MSFPARLRIFAFLAAPLAAASLITPALAGGSAAPALVMAPALAPAPVVVMRYTFNSATAAGRIADSSGHGRPVKLRSADGGTVRFIGTTAGYASFPAPCARGASPCARALLEAPNATTLNPGTRPFSWGATVRVGKAQVVGSANVMQKGVVTTESQWKLQLGAHQGRAQCVVVGRGNATPYLVRSSGSVADGAWHRILCRRAGTTLTVFVDGKDRGHLTIPAALSIGNTLPMRIGGPNFASTSDMFHGQLDDAYAVLG
jgi:Concanavalin A-like lectin/glucanases superfamily